MIHNTGQHIRYYVTQNSLLIIYTHFRTFFFPFVPLSRVEKTRLATRIGFSLHVSIFLRIPRGPVEKILSQMNLDTVMLVGCSSINKANESIKPSFIPGVPSEPNSELPSPELPVVVLHNTTIMKTANRQSKQSDVRITDQETTVTETRASPYDSGECAICLVLSQQNKSRPSAS